MPTPTAHDRGLIRRLAEATRRGTVPWVLSSPGRFDVETHSGRVSVWSADADDQHPFVFQVVNPAGTPIMSHETMVGQEYQDWEAEVADLYQAARNKALGVDEVLTGLEADLGLDQIEDPGPDIPF